MTDSRFQKSLGKANVSFTLALPFVLESNLYPGSELHRIHLLGSSAKKLSDEALFLELTRRGDDLSGLLRENEETAEIVKIG